MKKAPEAFRTISEVADLLDTPAHVLRFWESKFYQIRPVKRAGGRRYYRPDDVALINGIRALLQDRGMTIRGAQRILQEEGVKAVAQLGLPLPNGGQMLRVVRTAPPEADDDLHDITPDDDPFPPAPETVTAGLPVSVEGAEPALPNPVASNPQISVETQPVPEYALIQAMVEHGDQAAPVQTPGAEGDDQGDAMSDEDLLSPLADLPDPVLAPAEHRRLPRTLAPEPVEDSAEIPQRAQIARALRQMPRNSPALQRDRLGLLARRIDALLERMSEASGAGRW